jgi:polyhydroxybutyrate depolymerase
MKNGFLVLALALVLGCSSNSDNTGGSSGAGGSTGDGGVGGAGGDSGAGGGGGGGAGGTGGNDFSANPPTEIGTEERPASVAIPTDYDPAVTYPLLVVLHGRGANGRIQAGYFELFRLVDPKQFVMIYPDGGTFDSQDRRVWNGAGCCTEPSDPIDDVGYLSDLIDEAKRTYNVDPKRVYLMGHSNGGFMSFRMACEAADRFTAMVSLAGSTWLDPLDCQPGTPPVSVLAVHGTADETVLYEGGMFEFEGMVFGYPGAIETVERSATTASCDTGTTTTLGTADFVPLLDGEETEMVGYQTGCDEGLDMELWTIQGGSHIPGFSINFSEMALDWLFRHSR